METILSRGRCAARSGPPDFADGFHMSDPDPKYERKVLLDVVEQMEDRDKTTRRQRVVLRAIFALVLWEC